MDVIVEKVNDTSINNKYKKNLIDIINLFLKYYETTNFNILESNGQSFVVISDSVNEVIQYYVNYERYNRVISAYTCGEDNINIVLYKDCYSKPVHIDYKFIDYLPKLIYHCAQMNNYSYVVWEKIFSLNSFTSGELKPFIVKNFTKLVWDISKALEYFHRNNFLHGDPTIDNIGINSKGNFILFDFDASNKTLASYENSYTDYRKFFKSIAFHLDDRDIENYILENEYKPRIMFEKFSKFSQIEVDKLDILKIVY